ncbi:AAA family ATPase [Brachyspira sp.]|uniref:AAA family ATPase n=1 Tax=Brachyspira sp. TaxID=1977261 RepID=UPI003D7CE510
MSLKGTENLQKDLKQLQISAVKWVNSNSVLEETKENEIFKEFINFVDRMLLFWSLEYRSFVGYAAGRQTLIKEIIKLGHFEDFKSFFKEAGIEDEFEYQVFNGEPQLLVKYGAKNSLQFERVSSSGMSSLLLVYFWLQDLLNNSNNDKSPSFICIDEFDAFYHFELSRFIIEKLKKCNCQVLLTTHNTALLTNDILRPDCYYICSKKKILNVNNATEKELRQGHNLEKLYRGGTFGL